jgi:HAD superfamily hydrolase (TIGR01484 family)
LVKRGNGETGRQGKDLGTLNSEPETHQKPVIKLFVTDIDGCLSMPYEPYDLDGFAALRRYANDAGPPAATERAPAVSICSGRAYAYVESVTQALGLTTPVLFEGGGGIFDPVAAQTTWNPVFTPEVEAELETVRHWFLTECIPGTKLSLDYAKRTQAGVVTPDSDEIRDLRPRTEAYVAENVPDLEVYATDNSVDVVPSGITKRNGLEWIADELELDLQDVAYIGDTDADLEALMAVGLSFAPANAHGVVLDRVDHVTDAGVIDGTLEAYRHCLEHNEGIG